MASMFGLDRNEAADEVRAVTRTVDGWRRHFEESGVTRGGITYHFATKQALLRALVEADIEQWQELEDRHRPAKIDAHTAELLAEIRSHTARNEDRRRFVAGMLSALSLDRSLLDPVREHIAEKRAAVVWDDMELRRHLLRLAAGGLFWSELFEYGVLEPGVRERLVALMERLALELGDRGALK